MADDYQSLPFRLDDAGDRMRQALDTLLEDKQGERTCTLRESTRREYYELSLEERLALIDQALFLFRELYVNRPLKEAIHAVQPVRRLELLRLEVERKELTHPLDFHRGITEIFMSVQDRHMRYFLPERFHRRWAILGFEVEQYYETTPEEGFQPHYMVTRVVRGFEHPGFGPGAEVVSWNGVPIGRAVELNGDRHAGSNPAAHHARGLTRLTVRPLWVSPKPDEEWVIVGYRKREAGRLVGDTLYLKLNWWVVTLKAVEEIRLGPPATDGVEEIRLESTPPPAEEIRVGAAARSAGAPGGVMEEIRVGLPPAEISAALDESLDDEGEAVGQLRKELLIQRSSSSLAEGVPDHWSRMPGTLKGAVFPSGGGWVGYLRIYSFAVDDVDAFVAEVARQLRRFRELFDARGLILDVRDNGGGDIPAGERLLQLLTPRPVEPQRFELPATPAALKLCRAVGELSRWTESLEDGAKTGARYSQGFPITEPAADGGAQVFDRPVVLIVNALSYSTTDIFAAGFQDHGLGKVLATDDNIGAGGANTVSHETLLEISRGALPELRPLPGGAGMKVALRRALRVGERAGTPLEALGIRPDDRHYMTAKDLLEGNQDLIGKAIELLSTVPHFDVSARRSGRGAAAELSRLHHQVARVDLRFVDRAPVRFAKPGRDGVVAVAMAAPTAVRADGFDSAGKLVASRRADLESRLDLRTDPFLDLYFFVRALAAGGLAVTPEPGYEKAVDACRRVRSLDRCDVSALGNSSADGLRLSFPEAAELAEGLESVAPHFRRVLWPRHRSAADEAIRWLRESFVEREALADAMSRLGIDDPVVEVPVYLVARAPSPGAFHYSLGESARRVCVVDLVHHDGRRLAEALLRESISVLGFPASPALAAVVEEAGRRLP